MKIKVNIRLIAFSLIVIIFTTNIKAYSQLDPLYLRNGTCYLLVSDDNHTQDPLDGVYQINRTPTGNPEKLFYPGLTYGIGVDLNFNIHTFSEKKGNEWKPYIGPTRKIVNFKQRLGYYTGAAWWHRCIVQVNGATRIPGSERHFPCEAHLHPPGSWKVIQESVNGDPGLKLLEIPSGFWYHSKDPANRLWSVGWFPPDGNETRSMSYGQPVNNNIRSYKMYKDEEKRLDHIYYRHTWKPGDGPETPRPIEPVAESYEVDITRYIRNGCFDGCGIDIGQEKLDADRWHTSMVFNRFAKAYFYARKIGSTEAYIDINRTRYYSYPVIGAMNNQTSLDIGVSMKSATEDYVYILGADVAHAWLSKYLGDQVRIDYSTSAVSDQWWLNGGVVFIYDKSGGTVYEIERNENIPDNPNDPYKSNKIVKVSIYRGLGSDIDDLGTDGFGSLYYTKSEFVPPKPQDFNFNMRLSVSWNPPSGNRRTGVVKYRQNIYKTVFKKSPEGAKTTEGRLQIGFREYNQNIEYKPYTPTSDLNDISKWHALGDPYLVHSSIGNVSRTELAVINVAAPPPISSHTPLLDICGPFGDDGSGKFIAAVATDALQPFVTYKFEVENFPIHNGRINQRTSTDSNVDERFRCIDRHPFNGQIGRFISTLKVLGNSPDECVLYHWKVRRIKNLKNEDVNEIIFERGNNSNYYRHYIYISLDPGVYEISVSARYQWYDTSRLRYGSTVASLPEVLRPSSTSYEYAKAIDNSNYAKLIVTVSGINPPQPIESNVTIKRQKNNNTWVKYDQKVNGHEYFVITEGSSQIWQVIDESANELIRKIRLATPPYPIINEPNVYIRESTLEWIDDVLDVKWYITMLDPNLNNGYGEYSKYFKPNPIQFRDLTIGWSKIQRLSTENSNPPNSENFFYLKTGLSRGNADDEWKEAFSIPSDPGLYELRCEIVRRFIFEKVRYFYDSSTGMTRPGDPEPDSRAVQITGLAKVLVLDNTPPNIASFTVNREYLYAETGSTLAAPVLGNTINPPNLIFEIPDNNPMAFLNQVKQGGRHNRSLANANIYYDCSDGYLGVGVRTISPTPANISIISSNTQSIIRVTIPISNFSANMPITKAIKLKNNVISNPPYTINDVELNPITFGIKNVVDTSNNLANVGTTTGYICMIDTIRPNISIQIQDDKFEYIRYVPDSEMFTFRNYIIVSNNLETWSGNPLTNIGTVNIDGNLLGPLYARFTSDPSKPLEVDVPITFSILGQDNITSSQFLQFSNFRIRKIAPSESPFEYLNIPKHSKIFRIDTNEVTETWEIYGEVSDLAVGLPSNLLNPNSPTTTFNLRRNIRKLEKIPFEIRNTLLDVRVIEKTGK